MINFDPKLYDYHAALCNVADEVNPTAYAALCERDLPVPQVKRALKRIIGKQRLTELDSIYRKDQQS